MRPRCAAVATGLSLPPHHKHGTGCQQSWSYCSRPLLFTVNWKHFCSSLPTDTGKTDDCSVMHRRSSVGGAIQMTQLQLHHLLIISKVSPHTIPEQDLLSKHAKHDLYLHNDRWDNTHKTLRSIIHILKLKPLLLLKSVSKSHTQH